MMSLSDKLRLLLIWERIKQAARIAVAIMCAVILLDYLFGGWKAIPKECDCTCASKEVHQ